MFQNVQQIQDFIRQNGIAFLDFKMIDLRGRWKHLSIPAARFNEDIMTHGIGFDGSNYGYAQVERSDMVFLPDITTAVVDPFVKAPTLTMIGDVMVIDHPANRPFDQYPRNVAKSAIAHMQALGVADEMIIGPEYEFHVFDGMTRTLRPDAVGYRLQCSESVWSAGEFPNNGFHTGPHDGYHADLPGDRTFDLRNQICLELAKWGVDVKYHHHEVGGSGQLEIEVELGEMTRLADATMAAKYVIRNTAAANGMTATLMPKPIYGEAGNGMHVHMLLRKNGQPVFYDPDGYGQLSRTAMHFIGGLLTHARSLCAITNPSTNSYKRLIPGFEAPVTIGYAMANRSRNISAGVSELAMSTFVETNVAPHTATLKSAARWYLYSVYFIIRLQNYSFFIFPTQILIRYFRFSILFSYLCVLLCVMTIITTNNNKIFQLKCKVKVLLNYSQSFWRLRVFTSSPSRSRRGA